MISREPTEMSGRTTIDLVVESIQAQVDELGEAMEQNPPRRKRIRKLTRDLVVVMQGFGLKSVVGHHHRVELEGRALKIFRLGGLASEQ